MAKVKYIMNESYESNGDTLSIQRYRSYYSVTIQIGILSFGDLVDHDYKKDYFENLKNCKDFAIGILNEIIAKKSPGDPDRAQKLKDVIENTGQDLFGC